MIKRGFSLMEMMVVMLIVAVIAAASAPMISKKMIQNASGDSPWIWTSATNNSIAYNLKGQPDASATIGAAQPTKDAKDAKTAFHIQTKDGNPQITFGTDKFKDNNGNPKSFFIRASKDKNVIQLSDGNDGADLTNSIRIGLGQTSFQNQSSAGLKNQVLIGNNIAVNASGSDGGLNMDGFTALGHKAQMGGKVGATAIGYNAQAMAGSTVALGINSQAQYNSSIAIGSSAKAVASRAIAIGSQDTFTAGDNDPDYKGETQATGGRSIAIGANAYTSSPDTIAVGSNTEAIGGGEGTSRVASVSLGHKAISNQSIAIGHNVSAKNKSIAIGIRAKAEKSTNNTLGDSIAIGEDAYAKGLGVISIGTNTNLNGGNWFTEPEHHPGNYSIAIGHGAYTNYVTYGPYEFKSSNFATAIGHDATAGGPASLAVGYSSFAFGSNCIAIGNGATASNYSNGNAIAIGPGANAKHTNSIVIGVHRNTMAPAESTAPNQIVLGTKNDTVYIPGNLVVRKQVALGLDGIEPFICGYEEGKSSKKYFAPIKDNEFGNELQFSQSNWSNNGLSTDYPAGYSFSSPSDRRLKDVAELFKGGLEEIKKLEVFNYTFKKDPNKTPRVGVMAQDLEKIFPKAVFKGDDGFLRIRMEDMFYALVNAVKELDTKIENIISEVKTVVADVVDLKKKSAEYEKTIAELVEQNKAQDKALKDLEKRLAKLEKKASKVTASEEVIEE